MTPSRGISSLMMRTKLTLLPVLSLTVACSARPLPRSVAEAQQVSVSKAGQQAQELSPQAFADAERLRGEGEFLHGEGRHAEAEAAGEQSIAAYNEAFALAQVSLAERRLEAAKQAKTTAAQELKRLDLLQSQIEQEAESFEMQARVALDTEEVKDAEQLSPARAEARRLAAKHLSAEASLLCLGAELLKTSSKELPAIVKKVGVLEGELDHGSVKKDLYPRAAELRASCLKELTWARRPNAQAEPQSASSDKLLSHLAAPGKYMVYRDDRGVAINLGQPVLTRDNELALSDFVKEALLFLGGTAKANPDFPLLVVVHTKKRGQQKRAEKIGQLTSEALIAAGAPSPTVRSVENAQPIAFASVRGGAERNERVEVIFVPPGR